MEREPRADKVAIVTEVRERVEASSAVLLTEFRGIDVVSMATLRSALRAAGGEYKIYKNTLVRLATADVKVDGLQELLVGPTGLAFVGGDAAPVAKALQNFAKDHEGLVIKGGLLGDELLEADQVIELAALPPRQELLARLAGGMAAPSQDLAGLLYAVLAKFGHAVNALIEERGTDETD